MNAQTPSLSALVAVPVACVLFFSLFTLLYQFPAFRRQSEDIAIDQAITAAQLLAASLIGEEDQMLERGSLNPDLLQRIEQVRRQGQILRLRLYSPRGEVVHSSQSGELGRINRDPYFQEIVIGHKAAAAQAGRGHPSLEGQYYPAEIIEAYVPVVRQGRLLGVLEIYYNAAPQGQRRRSLFGFSAAVLAFASAVLLAAAGLSASNVRRRLRERQATAPDLE